MLANNLSYILRHLCLRRLSTRWVGEMLAKSVWKFCDCNFMWRNSWPFTKSSGLSVLSCWELVFGTDIPSHTTTATQAIQLCPLAWVNIRSKTIIGYVSICVFSDGNERGFRGNSRRLTAVLQWIPVGLFFPENTPHSQSKLPIGLVNIHEMKCSNFKIVLKCSRFEYSHRAYPMCRLLHSVYKKLI